MRVACYQFNLMAPLIYGLIICLVSPLLAKRVENDQVFFHLLSNPVIDDFINTEPLGEIFKSELDHKPGFDVFNPVMMINSTNLTTYTAATAKAFALQAGVSLVVLGSFERKGPYVRLTFGLFDTEKDRLIHEINEYILGHNSEEWSTMIRTLGRNFITPEEKFQIPNFIILSKYTQQINSNNSTVRKKYVGIIFERSKFFFCGRSKVRFNGRTNHTLWCATNRFYSLF